MVTQKNDIYQCDDCKLWYHEFELAKKCEDWCKKTNSCNFEITKKRVIF